MRIWASDKTGRIKRESTKYNNNSSTDGSPPKMLNYERKKGIILDTEL